MHEENDLNNFILERIVVAYALYAACFFFTYSAQQFHNQISNVL